MGRGSSTSSVGKVMGRWRIQEDLSPRLPNHMQNSSTPTGVCSFIELVLPQWSLFWAPFLLDTFVPGQCGAGTGTFWPSHEIGSTFVRASLQWWAAGVFASTVRTRLSWTVFPHPGSSATLGNSRGLGHPPRPSSWGNSRTASNWPIKHWRPGKVGKKRWKTTLNSSFLDVRCASKTCFVIFVLEYRDVKGDEEGNAAQNWSNGFLFVSICTIFILIMSTVTTHFPSFLGLGFAARPIQSTLRVRSWSNNSNHISHHCSDSWADLHISDAAALPESTTKKARMEQNGPGEFLELETSLFEVEVEALANKHHILPIGSYHMILSATSCLLRRCETHIEVIMETASWYGHLWVAHVWVCIVNVDFQQKHEGRMIHGMRLA